MGVALLALIGCTASAPGAGPEVWSAPAAHPDDAFLFAHDRINRIDIELAADDRRTLAAERVFGERFEVGADVTIDGEALGEVGVRIRGRLGSFRGLDDKPKLRLDFDDFGRGRKFVGLKGLDLGNANEDCSFVRQSLAFEVFDAAGLPAGRTGFAQVFVDGDDYGIYEVIERQDDEFLERVFGDDEGGAFYDGSYYLRGWWPKFLDFGVDRDGWFDLEEGEDLDFGRIREVSAAIDRDAAPSADLQALVDYDELRRHFAVEEWIGADDNYVVARNNWKVWFPADGKMQMVAWDLEYSFHDSEIWDRGLGNLAHVCFADAECRRAYEQEERDVAALLDTIDWVAVAEARIELVRDGVDGDPRGHCDAEQIEAQRDEVLEWLTDASERLVE